MATMANDLVSWLAENLEERGWSLRELARRAEISHTTVSSVLKEQQAPSWEFCAEIARVFGLQPERVFVMAGLMPAPPPPVLEEHEAVALLRSLDPGARAYALAMLRGLAGLPPATRVLPGGAGEAPSGVPLKQLRSLAERVARLSPEAQARVMEAFLSLLATMGVPEG
jgi:DNA-binding XRE family transcriptional regulator